MLSYQFNWYIHVSDNVISMANEFLFGFFCAHFFSLFYDNIIAILQLGVYIYSDLKPTSTQKKFFVPVPDNDLRKLNFEPVII